MNINKVSIFFI